MKKILALTLALMMVLALAACGDKDPAPSGDSNKPGTSQQGNNKGGSGKTPSTDYFWEKYDFTEEWMLPDDGVYTGYTYTDPTSNPAGNEMVTITVYDITEEQIKTYIEKIKSHGYEELIGDSYSKVTDTGTAMIKISNFLAEDGYIRIMIDPKL